MSNLIIDRIDYRQESDNCSSNPDIDQKLTVEFDSAGAGYFYRLITDGWSFDDDATVFFRHLLDICKQNDGDGE